MAKIVKAMATEDALNDLAELGIDMKQELTNTTRAVENDPTIEIELTVHMNDGTQVVL